MSRASDIIGVRTEPEDDGFGDDAIEWHIVSVSGMGGSYATACGLDGDDPLCMQFGTVANTSNAQVTCVQCRHIWLGFKKLKLRENDFDMSNQRHQ